MMNYRNLYDPERAAEGYLSRMMSRFTTGAIINIIVALFVIGILIMTFLYVGFIFLKNM